MDIVKNQMMINTIQTNTEESLRGSSMMSEMPKISDQDKLATFETLGRISADNDGRIIKDENEEVIKVDASSFWKLLRYGGGIKFMVLINLFNLCLIITNIWTDYTIGNWAKDIDNQNRLWK